MNITIHTMQDCDWESVAAIYEQGIKSVNATFRSILPTFEEWNNSHIRKCRLVAVTHDKIVGWAALTKTSGMSAFDGVAELSLYIADDCKRKGIGKLLLENLITDSEKNGFWTLQSNIFQENLASIELHKKCGFRVIGIRERVAKDKNGNWRTNVLLEKRSTVVGID
jgi:L-amino acid N-acyltransferase YncA